MTSYAGTRQKLDQRCNKVHCNSFELLGRLTSPLHLLGSSKILTVIYYDTNGRARAMHAEAMQEGIYETASDEDWIRAEWFGSTSRVCSFSTKLPTGSGFISVQEATQPKRSLANFPLVKASSTSSPISYAIFSSAPRRSLKRHMLTASICGYRSRRILNRPHCSLFRQHDQVALPKFRGGPVHQVQWHPQQRS